MNRRCILPAYRLSRKTGVSPIPQDASSTLPYKAWSRPDSYQMLLKRVLSTTTQINVFFTGAQLEERACSEVIAQQCIWICSCTNVGLSIEDNLQWAVDRQDDSHWSYLTIQSINLLPLWQCRVTLYVKVQRQYIPIKTLLPDPHQTLNHNIQQSSIFWRARQQGSQYHFSLDCGAHFWLLRCVTICKLRRNNLAVDKVKE